MKVKRFCYQPISEYEDADNLKNEQQQPKCTNNQVLDSKNATLNFTGGCYGGVNQSLAGYSGKIEASELSGILNEIDNSFANNDNDSAKKQLNPLLTHNTESNNCSRQENDRQPSSQMFYQSEAKSIAHPGSRQSMGSAAPFGTVVFHGRL